MHSATARIRLEGTEQESHGDKDAGESVAGRGGKQERRGGRSIASLKSKGARGWCESALDQNKNRHRDTFSQYGHHAAKSR